MSFKWKCAYCGKGIIVPYESPNTMSGYAAPYCEKCFDNNIDICEYTGEFYETEDENGNKVNCYHDMEGMIFSCKEE